MNNKNNEQKGWRQTLLVDKKQLDSFNKDINKLFPFSMTITPWADKISKVVSQYDQTQIKLAKQQKNTFQKLAEIASDVNNLRQVLKFYDQTNQYLVKVQNASQTTLGKLQNFRAKMGAGYEQLAEAEQKLNDELQMLNKKIEGIDREEGYQLKENLKNGNKEVKMWDKPNYNQRKGKNQEEQQIQDNSQLKIIEKRLRQTQKQVQVVQKAIVALGRNLGWPQEDHNDFLSIWHRGSSTKNYFQIEEELQGYFQFYTAEEIQQHMNKYIKWKKLAQEKKELIIIYKNVKEEKKMAELDVLHLQKAKSREKREKEEQRRREDKDQEKMKNKIDQWKQTKNKEKREQQERKIRQQQQRRRLQAIKRKDIQQRNRQLLQRWKQQQAQKKQHELKRINSAKKPTPVDKQAEERIKARQMLLVQKKVQLFNQKKRQQEYHRYKQQKVKEDKFVKFSHVNNKLEHKTTAIKQKQRQKFDGKQKKDANTFGGQLLMTGVRATPTWMKGL